MVNAGACSIAPRSSLLKEVKCLQYVSWRERIRAFSWQWHAIVMATTVTSSLIHLFPYHNNSQALKFLALIIFLVGLAGFVFNAICMLYKAYLYPKEWLPLVTDLNRSCFAGFVAVSIAGLVEGALNVNKDWHIGHNGLLYTLWGFWWLDVCLAYTISFGVIYSLLGQKSKDLSQVLPVWIVPIVALVTVSTCGGLLSEALAPHSPTLALVSTTVALGTGIIGLSFTTMISWSYLLRLFLHGAPDATAVLATLNTLTPLGQGGYSLLVNGHNLSKLLPIDLRDSFMHSNPSGEIIFSVCFCLSFALWCTGLAWITVSIFVIARRARRLPRFCITWWCIVFPNGVFALCSLQLGNVLDSPFYRAFGAAWSIIVFAMWTSLVLRSVPAFIDGTLFMLPVPRVEPAWKAHVTSPTHIVPPDPHDYVHGHDDNATVHEPEYGLAVV